MSSKKKRRSSMKSAKAAGPSSNGSSEPQQSQTPSPEVLEKPTRRRFTVCTIWSPSIGSLHNGHDFGSP